MEEQKNQSFLFENLKKIRLEKNITLESISDKYRVQIKYLQSLENGDLLEIPEVYDKLFFRSYLKALNLKEEDYYDDFIDYRRAIRLDKTTSVFDFSGEQEKEPKYINYRNLFVALPFIIVIIVVWILIKNTESIKSSDNNNVNAIDVQDIVRKIEQKEKSLQDSLSQVDFKNDTLLLTVSGLKQTWFRVVRDQADTSEYLFNGGESMQLQAMSSFEFLIGRADGLKLNLNGQNLPAIGTDSTVVRYLKVDSTGIAERVLKSD
jgi:cytoskeletal protein RodZ